jgi:hypothetical protein
MPSHHDDVRLTPGEAWVAYALLLDADGQGLDLTGAELSWTLRNRNGAIVPVSAILTVVDVAGGIVTITLDPAATAMLEPGYYVDALRCRVAGTSSLWVGGVCVSANPFFAVAKAPPPNLRQCSSESFRA